MGLRPHYLGDTSALARRDVAAVGARLDLLLEAGLVARCTPTDLEAGYSSRDAGSHQGMRRQRAAWPFVEMDQTTLDRAVAVQDLLVARGAQRGTTIADLLIAAAAEAAGLVILHDDRAFEVIAAVTGQPTEWIVPAGSVP